MSNNQTDVASETKTVEVRLYNYEPRIYVGSRVESYAPATDIELEIPSDVLDADRYAREVLVQYVKKAYESIGETYTHEESSFVVPLDMETAIRVLGARDLTAQREAEDNERIEALAALGVSEVNDSVVKKYMQFRSSVRSSWVPASTWLSEP